MRKTDGKQNIVVMNPTLTENMYTFMFCTDRPLTNEEKMQIASRGLSALNEILETELGSIADHNSSFCFEQWRTMPNGY